MDSLIGLLVARARSRVRNSGAVAGRCFIGGGVAGAKLRPRGIATTEDASLCAGRAGYRVKEVAEYFGRDAATIGSLVSRYEPKVQNEPELGRGVDQLAQFV